MIRGSAACASFKRELFLGVHDLAGDQFRLALYTGDANLGPDTTGYVTEGEVVGIGYTPGGQNLAGAQVLLDPATRYAYATFQDAVWDDSVITARAALLYNQTKGGRAVAVIDFAVDRVSNHGPFRVVFPPAQSDRALLRIY